MCRPAQDSPYLSQKPPFPHIQRRKSQFRRDCSMPAVPNRQFQKAFSSTSISTNSLSIWSPPDTIVKKASSPQSPYKSLPALDKHFDQLDRELQEISDSVDVLYQQEDTEIEFLDTFLDYDSISIDCKESDQMSESLKLSKTNPQGLPPIMANDKERIPSRKDKIQERLRWLTSRSKLTMQNFGSRDNLKNMKEGLQKSKERLSCALSPGRNRRGSYEWSVRLNSDGHNARDSIIVMDGGEEQGEEEVVKKKMKVKSFEVPVLKVKEYDNQGKPKYTKYTKSKKGRSHIVQGEYVKPVEDLEKLEKLILRDSVRETLQKKREMGPINEELDMAFNNLSYDELDISGTTRDARKYYENVDNTKSVTERMYENVQADYENASVDNQHYENFPNVEPQKLQTGADEDYENYDFGESGIYQNILYDRSDNSIHASDLNSQVHTLRKSVNEVNRIVQESKPHEKDESQPFKLFQSKLDIRLKLPSYDATKKDEDKHEVDTKSVNKTILNGENVNKIETKGKPTTLKKPTSSIFRKWALSKAEHPKIDLSKFKETSTDSKSTFTQREKEIVAKFLEDVKSDLHS